MGMMLDNLCHPYLLSTSVLSDILSNLCSIILMYIRKLILFAQFSLLRPHAPTHTMRKILFCPVKYWLSEFLRIKIANFCPP